MKIKRWALGLLGVAGLLVGFAQDSDAGWFDHCCGCHHCDMHICCRQYNAFTPVCFGNVHCIGCCPQTCGMPESCSVPQCGMPPGPMCGAGMPFGYGPPPMAMMPPGMGMPPGMPMSPVMMPQGAPMPPGAPTPPNGTMPPINNHTAQYGNPMMYYGVQPAAYYAYPGYYPQAYPWNWPALSQGSCSVVGDGPRPAPGEAAPGRAGNPASEGGAPIRHQPDPCLAPRCGGPFAFQRRSFPFICSKSISA